MLDDWLAFRIYYVIVYLQKWCEHVVGAIAQLLFQFYIPPWPELSYQI